ncbi:RNA-binding protein, putative [Leishmania tarentolae]|uniref:RNA-binding protein, putative n=1 Tax=Leishmania tarentolae TaxID=5689 RepID=A0A640KMD2_LEITA|nr:RNA-binding protein, putative [Leishmania tarentolae]
MYFVAATPSQVSPPGVIAAPAPLPFGTPLKDISMISFGHSNSSTAVSAAPPSYEAVALDPKGPRSQTNLFVRKLASAVTEDDMRKLFEQYGTIMSFALMRDIHTGESLGTAFVRYSTHEEARAAMAALDGRELYGRPISIQWAKREHDSTPCGDARRKIRKLFVRNIPLDVTARHLRQIFSKFGSINNVTLHSDTAPAVARDNGDNSRLTSQMRNIAFILFKKTT